MATMKKDKAKNWKNQKESGTARELYREKN